MLRNFAADVNRHLGTYRNSNQLYNMKTSITLMMAAIVAATITASCSDETATPQQETRTPLSISTYMPRMTRANVEVATINSLTEAGGGFTLRGYYDDKDGIQQTMLDKTYYADAGTGSSQPSDGETVFWPHDKQTEVTFAAIYPANSECLPFGYDGSVEAYAFDFKAYNVDQSVQGQIDYLVAYKQTSESETSGGQIELTFKHLMAQAVLNVSCDDATKNFELISATLIAPQVSTLNCSTGAITIREELGTMTYDFLANDQQSTHSITQSLVQIGSLMVPAASSESEGTTCTLDLHYTTTINGREKEYHDQAEITLMAGYQTKVNVTVSGDAALNIELVSAGEWERLIDGYEYVDLGLPSGLLWATCNIGASSPEEYGDYFAWGETTGYNSGKTEFSWTSYSLCDGSEWTMNKYCTSADYGIVDNKTFLELVDDAANANWGGDWRMPTIEDWRELQNNCTWTWISMNNVDGYKVTASNGNYIFLPAAGYRYDYGLDTAGSNGYYWSSSLNTGYSYYAQSLYFNSGYVNASYYDRYLGQSVRAVRVAE